MHPRSITRTATALLFALAVQSALRADQVAFDHSTFLGGGAADHVSSVAMDGNGFAYVTGRTSSDDFPSTIGAPPAGDSAFVAKLDPAGLDSGNCPGGLCWSRVFGSAATS